MSQLKAWPHLTIIGVVVALLAGLGTAWYLKHEQTASAEELPYAARIQRVDGEVALSDFRGDSTQNAESQRWIAATANQPFSVGDRIYTRDNARTSLAFNGRNFARLDPNTSLDVVNLYDGRTQLALREGSAIFDVGYPGDLFEVGTPYGAVQFDQPGLYDVGFDNNGNVLVSVLSGVAQVVGMAGSGQINKGEMLTLVGQTAANLLLSKLDGRDAGYLVDDYYRYQYPNVYDGRYNSYDAYLNDPYYYDPYRRNPSYQYVSSIIPGINDLDYYGDWQSVDNYGYAWRPRVDSGWAPYQQGYWTTDYPYGATWVSSEPWGYAPYHYGRWANVGNQWYWIPDGVNTTPVYSPALVAFVPVDGNQVGWVPLAPGERYVSRYYDENWQPHYLGRADLSPAQLINLGIPGAVTVVPVDAFGRAIEARNIRRQDPRVFAGVRPTLEPLALTPLRNAVINSAWGRGKISLPPGIAKQLDDRSIMMGHTPVSPRFRKDLAKSLRLEQVSEKGRKEKLNFRHEDRRDVAAGIDTRRGKDVEKQQREQERNFRKAIEQPRGERVGNPVRHIEQPQRHVEQPQRQQEKAMRKAAQQPQGERIGNPGRQKAERQQSRPEFKGPPPKTGGGESHGGGKGKGKGKG
jgi:FecR protein